MTQNIGSLENYGMEFSINAKPIVTKDFTWDLSYNITWNHNEITKLTGGDDSDYYVEAGDKISRGNNTKVQAHKVGYAANSFLRLPAGIRRKWANLLKICLLTVTETEQ